MKPDILCHMSFIAHYGISIGMLYAEPILFLLPNVVCAMLRDRVKTAV